MSNTTTARITIKPHPNFKEDYLRLLAEVKEAVKYESDDMLFDGYINYDCEPLLYEDFMLFQLEFDYIPYNELVDLATDYNCNISFIFSDEFAYDPNKYWDQLDYELEDYDDGIWLYNPVSGMNFAGEIKVIELTDENGTKYYSHYTNTYIPKDKNEYYLMYMAAGDWSFNNDKSELGEFYASFADYIKQLYEEVDFFDLDTFPDNTWVAYITNTDSFIEWLRKKQNFEFWDD